jgi:Lar family restriction alleviation protein
MSEKLLPCPFCGGEASVHRGEHAFYDAKIRCAGCQAEGPIFDVDDGEANEAGQNEAESIAAWNRRTPAPEGEAWGYATRRIAFADGTKVDGPWGLDTGLSLDMARTDPCWEVQPLYASPVVPVGVSEVLDAAAAYLKDQYGASHGLDHPVDRARIIAALRPTDTGWRDIATAETTVLANTIRQHLLGIKPDDQAMVLEDDDWRLILKSLECQSAIDRPRQ